MRTSKRRDDWVPMLAVGLVAALVSYSAATYVTLRRPALGESPEIQFFRARYGPHHNSQGVEEWLIRDFFEDKRGGVFLDVGANHYQVHSTTYYLEHELGWSGIAVEAQAEFAPDYATHRPRTRFVPMFVGDRAGDTVAFYIPEQALNATAYRESTSGPVRERRVATTTLTAILDSAGISSLDFMSMDIELSEPAALKGFDIERFRPALVCIEDHPAVRKQIFDYFVRHGYRLVSKYLRADLHNLYFELETRDSRDGSD